MVEIDGQDGRRLVFDNSIYWHTDKLQKKVGIKKVVSWFKLGFKCDILTWFSAESVGIMETLFPNS